MASRSKYGDDYDLAVGVDGAAGFEPAGPARGTAGAAALDDDTNCCDDCCRAVPSMVESSLRSRYLFAVSPHPTSVPGCRDARRGRGGVGGLGGGVGWGVKPDGTTSDGTTSLWP
jgi:hypothetical protein